MHPAAQLRQVLSGDRRIEQDPRSSPWLPASLLAMPVPYPGATHDILPPPILARRCSRPLARVDEVLGVGASSVRM